MIDAPPDPAVRTAPGPRAAEAALLAEIAVLAGAAGNLAALDAPVRVVVPSRALQYHLSAALVARAGRAVAGVRIQTLTGLAFEVLERAGVARVPEGVLLEVLVRRFAGRQPLLRTSLGGLEDGYGAVLPAVEDLLNAGLLAEHGDAAAELLGASGVEPLWQERAAAVVEVAAACAAVLQAVGGGRREAALAQAAELLAGGPGRLLPARAVLAYGFAETTALAGDLLEVLVRRCGARVILDVPPDAALPSSPSPGAGFTDRLWWRLAGGGGKASGGHEEVPGPDVELVSAAGPDGEVRAVAERILPLLRAGVPPEAVAMVARSLEPYIVPIRRHFSRLGIPFSGLSAAAPAAPGERRRDAMLDLLELGAATPLGVWVEVLGALPGRESQTVPWELEVGLRTLGVAVVQDVAALPAEVLAAPKGIRLPLRRGLAPAGAGDPEERPERLQSCRLSGGALRAAASAARALVEVMESWPAADSLSSHLSRMDRVFAALGAPPGDPLRQQVAQLGDQVQHEIPGEFQLARGELAVLFRSLVRSGGRSPAGGVGGGVRLLSVTEYRGCTAAHLFLLGLNRDVFPRVVNEDPLLPDKVRAALRPLLPDLAVKAEGHVEERYLFDQALASCPSVTVSWQGLDEDGAERPLSPLVERLRLERGLPVFAAAQPFAGGLPAAPLSAAEAAAVGGLSGDRDCWQTLLAGALAEARGWLGGGPDAAVTAAARRRVLDELEPDWTTPSGRGLRDAPGPYLGFVGEGAGTSGPVWVTLLESLATCPWRTFLERRLGLEPPPLGGGVPGLDALLIGSTVHAVLEQLVLTHRRAAGGGETAIPVPWPPPEDLERLVAVQAAAQAREAGVAGLAGLLSAVVMPFLELARELEWQPEPPLVLGVELTGHAVVPAADGSTHKLGFRADRVDERAGRRVYTDYKTGRPLSAALGEPTRRKHLLAAIRTGERLQAAAYAASGGPGRYVYLGGLDRNWPARVFSVEPDDGEAREIFINSARTLLAAWREGGLPPRLADCSGREPAACGYCPVTEACLRGDTGARSRLLAWARRRSDQGEPLAGRSEEAAYRVWAIRGKPEGTGGRKEEP